ncbi:MAG TPA: hypothetical protein VIO62_18125 [Candidatus Dormibacteraeota bacterium]|jgi:pilus assembly protein CpaF
MAGAIDIVVELNRLKDGSRRVTSISEVVGIDGDTVTMQELFRFVPKGAGPDGKILGDQNPAEASREDG